MTKKKKKWETNPAMLSFPRCHSFCARYAECAANWPAPDDDALHQNKTKKKKKYQKSRSSNQKWQKPKKGRVSETYSSGGALRQRQLHLADNSRGQSLRLGIGVLELRGGADGGWGEWGRSGGNSTRWGWVRVKCWRISQIQWSAPKHITAWKI